MAGLRILEIVFLLYFLTHIPITVLIDSQIVFPAWIYPTFLRNAVENYSVNLKDPTVISPPPWYLSFCCCEVFLQFPFFFFATYAFWKGNLSWIRTPSIVYSAHVSTTLLPILSHFVFHDFSTQPEGQPGPSTLSERLTLCAIYSPYLIVPLLLLVTMLMNPNYGRQQRLKKLD